MLQSQTVLVVGGNGMLGEKIALALLAKPDVRVKTLVRNVQPSKAESRQRLENLRKAGATVIEGDLNDIDSLIAACKGVDAVISAVQGEEDIIIIGQQNLLRAAEATGVKRFIPSDYSVNYFNVDMDDNYNLAFRKRFASSLKASPIEHTFVLNGAFTEVELTPWGSMFDAMVPTTFTYWGDGETPVDMTTTDDTALYIAEAVLDPQKANSMLQVAGDQITMKQILATYQEVTGRQLQERRLGSVEELKQWIEAKKLTASSPNEYLPQQYHYVMVSGKGKLQPENQRYPDIKPVSFRQYLEQQQKK